MNCRVFRDFALIAVLVVITFGVLHDVLQSYLIDELIDDHERATAPFHARERDPSYVACKDPDYRAWMYSTGPWNLKHNCKP